MSQVDRPDETHVVFVWLDRDFEPIISALDYPAVHTVDDPFEPRHNSRNQTMNAAFFAAIGAAMIYYLVARVSMKMVVNKSDGVSSSAELMLAWMFVLTYIVAVGAIGVVTFTNVI